MQVRRLGRGEVRQHVRASLWIRSRPRVCPAPHFPPLCYTHRLPSDAPVSSLLLSVLAGGGLRHCPLPSLEQTRLMENLQSRGGSLAKGTSHLQALFGPWMDPEFSLDSLYGRDPLSVEAPAVPTVTCLPVTNMGLALLQRKAAAGVDQFLSNKDPVFMQTSSALKQKQILPRASPGCQVSSQDTFSSRVLRLRERLTRDGRRAVCQLPSVTRQCRTLGWNGNRCLEF